MYVPSPVFPFSAPTLHCFENTQASRHRLHPFHAIHWLPRKLHQPPSQNRWDQSHKAQKRPRHVDERGVGCARFHWRKTKTKGGWRSKRNGKFKMVWSSPRCSPCLAFWQKIHCDGGSFLYFCILLVWLDQSRLYKNVLRVCVSVEKPLAQRLHDHCQLSQPWLEMSASLMAAAYTLKF